MPALVVSVPSPELAAAIGDLPDDVELIEWAMTDASPRPSIDLVVQPYMSHGASLHHLRDVRTRLVQSQAIGYEGIDKLLPPGHRFANASSVHETSTAELALLLMLAAQRELPAFVAAQTAHEWRPAATDSLADRRVLLLGYGGVGKAIAARLAPFEVNVTAVASRARVEDDVVVHGVDELPSLLGATEILVLSLPGGEGTRNIVDDTVLAALPDGALVVNVGRGSLIDTDALADHVGRGRLRAALDVVDPEPLPADHPLWSSPGVLITPHVGGASRAMLPRMARLVREQIDRMRRGDEPRNIVFETPAD